MRRQMQVNRVGMDVVGGDRGGGVVDRHIDTVEICRRDRVERHTWRIDEKCHVVTVVLWEADQEDLMYEKKVIPAKLVEELASGGQGQNTTGVDNVQDSRRKTLVNVWNTTTSRTLKMGTTSPHTLWKDPFVVVNAAVALLVAYCFFAQPMKYVRITGECKSNWLFLGTPNNEPICCETSNAAPCYAGMDTIQFISHGQGAWVLPLAVVLFNFGATIFLPTVSQRHISALFNRLGLYFLVMVFRTLVLYVFFNTIESAMFPRPESCWYSKYRRSNTCLDGFDHADHVVLYVVHFLAISCFEWKVLGMEAAHPLKRVLLRGWLFLLIAIACYGTFHTAYSFHTAWESVIGLLVAQITVMLPLYLLSRDEWRQLHPLLKLNHFVCQK
ncbi:Aste57867_25089 [Aphanomyces stellatus]|uniref:Aste57867_25089 protein n=1 Tax=Aphanomyces stellatus TaxID=120398 RepID=A0A485LWP1_9STRA|nr:hypothetical protein As57867_025011 [Aphanomyces stellatus]VFU01720.1 Aste57867_25089 [Aphanomyces stellatus]